MVRKMKETQEQLEKSLRLLTHRLKWFTHNEFVSEEVNTSFNKLLIEKAVIAEKLKRRKNNSVKTFISKIKRHITGKKLICDNF